MCDYFRVTSTHGDTILKWSSLYILKSVIISHCVRGNDVILCQYYCVMVGLHPATPLCISLYAEGFFFNELNETSSPEMTTFSSHCRNKLQPAQVMSNCSAALFSSHASSWFYWLSAYTSIRAVLAHVTEVWTCCCIFFKRLFCLESQQKSHIHP